MHPQITVANAYSAGALQPGWSVHYLVHFQTALYTCLILLSVNGEETSGEQPQTGVYREG